MGLGSPGSIGFFASHHCEKIDNEVSLNANAVLKICDTVNIASVTVLTLISRAVANNDSHSNGIELYETIASASLIATNIESARKEAMLARNKMEETELTKKRNPTNNASETRKCIRKNLQRVK